MITDVLQRLREQWEYRATTLTNDREVMRDDRIKARAIRDCAFDLDAVLATLRGAEPEPPPEIRRYEWGGVYASCLLCGGTDGMGHKAGCPWIAAGSARAPHPERTPVSDYPSNYLDPMPLIDIPSAPNATASIRVEMLKPESARVPHEPPAETERQAILEAIDTVLNRQPVSDFMRSFSIVRRVIDWIDYADRWKQSAEYTGRLVVQREKELKEAQEARPAPPLDSLRARIVELKNGTIRPPHFAGKDLLEWETIQKTLNVVLAEIDRALPSPPAAPK